MVKAFFERERLRDNTGWGAWLFTPFCTVVFGRGIKKAPLFCIVSYFPYLCTLLKKIYCMRRMLMFLITGIVAGGMTGCREKKEPDHIITRKVVAKAPSQPIRMQDYVQSKDDVKWLGATYRCEIVRMADDSLAMVKDETGQKFVDNRISLEIRRADGSVFLKKSFTKKDFDACLDDDYRATGILEGLVFDRVDGQSVVFAASVSHPQTDEYIPLLVRVSGTGGISIARDTQMDTNAGDAGGDDSDEDGV